MRINFDGSARELLKLLDTAQSQPTKPSDFAPILDGVGSQPTKITDKNAQLPALSQVLEENAKARFNFKQPELLMPQIEVAPGPPPPPEPVKEAPNSVKTPTILSAKRLPEVVAFSSLSYDGRVDTVKKFVEAAGLKHGVDPKLTFAVVSAESSFDTTAVSSDGHFSKGLMQLLDETGKELHQASGNPGDYQPFNPQLNIDLGVRYLKRLHDLFRPDSGLGKNLKVVSAANSSSLEKLALASYNAGEGRVASAQNRAQVAGKDPSHYDQVEAYLPESTQQYVKRVQQIKSALGETLID